MDKSTFKTLLRSVGRDVERLTNPVLYKQTLPVPRDALNRSKIFSPFTRHNFNELLIGGLTKPNIRLMELQEARLAEPLKMHHAKVEVHDLTLSKSQQDIYRTNCDSDFDQLLSRLNGSGKYKLGIDHLVNYAAQQVSDPVPMEQLASKVVAREDLNVKQKACFLTRLLSYGGHMVEHGSHFSSLDHLVEQVTYIADEALQGLILRYYLKRGQSRAFINLLEECLNQSYLPSPDIIVDYIQLVASQSAPGSLRSRKQLTPLAPIIARVSTPQLVTELSNQLSTAKEFETYLTILTRLPNWHQLISVGLSNLTKAAIRTSSKTNGSNAAYASALLSQQLLRLESKAGSTLSAKTELVLSLVQAHISLGDFSRAAKYLRDSGWSVPLDQVLRRIVNTTCHSIPNRDTAPGSRVVDKSFFFFGLIQPMLREFIHYELFIQALLAFDLDASAFVEQQKSSLDNTKLKRLQELLVNP
ncbi:hypothetical protein LJB42_001227 [Komagataella kurtzmanii]|nr:hypothetical protein LJB42_001227 [Komagataella kurtzmanii]